MLGSPQLQQARSVDMFEAIARNLLNQTAVITTPGATDLRWASVIAQAYREGLAAVASQHRGGVLFRLTPDGHLEIIALEN